MVKSLADFNRELKERDIPTELVKGHGYFYFAPTDSCCFEPESIYVCHYNQMKPKFWQYQLIEIERLWKEQQA